MKTKEKQVRIIGNTDVTNSKIIYLPLKREPFAIMVTGEKQIEIRKQTRANRIKNQLVDSKTGKDKEYDYIFFRNGYYETMPFFLCEFKGFRIASEDSSVRYSDGRVINIKAGDTIILLGKVLECGNLRS